MNLYSPLLLAVGSRPMFMHVANLYLYFTSNKQRGDYMKKYLYLGVCMAISLVLLVGCGNYGNNVSVVETENAVTATASDQPAEPTDWVPTTIEAVNGFDGVTMNAKDGTVSSTGLTAIFKNDSSSQCIYGDYFSLEKKINGSWYQVPVAIVGNYGFNSIGYDLPSGKNGELAVDWDWLYGSLDAGEYRIVKDILDFRGTGDYNTYYLAAEFMIQ